ncbi:unnamed protein product [Arctogadus glacialis]
MNGYRSASDAAVASGPGRDVELFSDPGWLLPVFIARAPDVAAETLLWIYARRGEELRWAGMTDGSSPETLMMFECLE